MRLYRSIPFDFGCEHILASRSNCASTSVTCKPLARANVQHLPTFTSSNAHRSDQHLFPLLSYLDFIQPLAADPLAWLSSIFRTTNAASRALFSAWSPVTRLSLRGNRERPSGLHDHLLGGLPLYIFLQTLGTKIGHMHPHSPCFCLGV